MNVNEKNTAEPLPVVDPLNACQSVPGKHTALSDALVPSIYQSCVWPKDAVGAIWFPSNRRVYDLVCLCIIYGNELRIQVRERKKENKRRCEKGRVA